MVDHGQVTLQKAVLTVGKNTLLLCLFLCIPSIFDNVWNKVSDQ